MLRSGALRLALINEKDVYYVHQTPNCIKQQIC
jgi:hypothetical protein